MTRHHSCRVSPFGHPRIHARLAAPRGISQPPTSFIGSQCQGIHHAPLNTYNDNYKPIIGKIAHPHTTRHQPRKAGAACCARCSQPLSTNQTPHPTTKVGRQPSPPNRSPGAPQPETRGHGLVVSKPNSVFDDPSAGSITRSPTNGNCLSCTRTEPTTGIGPSNESLSTPNPRNLRAGHESRGAP